jgi:DNA-binding response OmpR family regulator
MAEHTSILIVDDEENLRRTLALILQREGYEVSTAASVAEGRQYLHSGTFNLVFLDLKLPDANGLTLLPEIREQHPETPVLILTAHDKLGVAIEAVTHGASDYLLKPIDPPLLIKRVKEILAQEMM